MKTNVWIMNHYATNMFVNKGGRHYWFAKYLKKEGYTPTVFCANTLHYMSHEKIDTGGALFLEKQAEEIGVPYVFIDTPKYQGNGFSRMKNMYAFYRNLFKVTACYAKQHGKPDVILASSVHPLTLVAGIKIARKYGVKCICEVRDLWPESFVEYKLLKAGSPLAKALYAGEKWIYEKADALIFTMQGGADYIREKGWSTESGGRIDLQKVHYINNGIDLPVIKEQRESDPYHNEKFDAITGAKLIYTGSIRKANDVGKILDTAKLLQDTDAVFCIFGDGEEREKLEKRVKDEQISNVIFFGRVEKKYISSIVSQAQLLLLLYSQDIVGIARYGMSQNKLFDYLAAGRPILSNLSSKYSIITQYDCGVERSMQTADEIAKQLKQMLADPEEQKRWGENAKKAAEHFSFEQHTKKLVQIIETI